MRVLQMFLPQDTLLTSQRHENPKLRSSTKERPSILSCNSTPDGTPAKKYRLLVTVAELLLLEGISLSFRYLPSRLQSSSPCLESIYGILG